MKRSTLFLALTLILSMIMTSCKKQLVEKYESSQQTNVAKTTAEIKASSSFKWNTANALNVTFTGVQNDIRVCVLKVVAPDGHVIFQKLQKANQDCTINVEIPSHYDKVDITYGGNKQSFDTKSGKVEMHLS